MLVQNWPTAFVLIAVIIMIIVLFINIIDRQRPTPTHCARCQKKLNEEWRTRAINQNEPDE